MKRLLQVVTGLVVIMVLVTCERSSPTREPVENDEHLGTLALESQCLLDYYPDLGTVLPEDYPMDSTGFDTSNAITEAEDFLVNHGLDLEGISKIDIDYCAFSGVALVEHLVDSKVIHVVHGYTDIPSVELTVTFNDPKVPNQVHYIIIVCDNGYTFIWDGGLVYD
ncbi:MAG: hypothetical protein K9M19_00120 [Candidatus Marinimicrobia bacterium]|nr:hypothetical protein [Candidatus Neomarinimicrobiota bacterium]